MRIRYRLWLPGLGLIPLILSFLFASQAYAQTPTPASPEENSQQPGVSNDYCLSCHGKPDQYFSLPSGEQVYSTIDSTTFHDSVHGQKGYACVQCHTDIRTYPHPPTTAQTARELTLQLNSDCARCHSANATKTQDSVHAKALAEGNLNAATCTDCHGAHNVQSPNQPRSRIPQTCERCHSEIYNLYKDSVHGEALLGEGNPDVPTCIDCHGVHNVQGPSTEPFALYSPEICAKCHTDPNLMGKYGIGTNVLNSYISDFHGKTVIFDAKAPGQQTNKPVCIDCHGIHDIKKPDDPHSTVMKENLLITCRRCHPDATANFPTAWMNHYEPSLQEFPLVYLVNLFYKIFIPSVIGFMLLFVLGDGARRIINRRKEKHNG